MTETPEPPGRCSFDVENVGGRIVVRVTGEVELTSAAAFRLTLRGIMGAERPDVVIDLSGVEFMDSTGLGVLVGAQRQARLFRGGLALLSPSPPVARLLHLTALNRVFTIVDRLDDLEGNPPAPAGTDLT
ncbi:STAS domain-containing protein [Nocardioides sp. R-C-SC26]|uniref:STAS domain-containing protein n=1 Tax=Nocardioides sp. R-C-SC26 TaxID=2870414 RepID=UPI001E566169|nr:STAS domain-containing protein [Nocardioides sp. R-C-SC26]